MNTDFAALIRTCALLSTAGFRLLLSAVSIPLVAQGTPQVRPEVDALLQTYMSDYRVVERQTKVEAELANRPDIKPDLFAALQRDYFQKIHNPRSSIHSLNMGALGSLAMRRDLSKAEQKLITDEMERVLPDVENIAFPDPAINLLAHYPTPEHEALVLKFLTRTKSSDYTILAAARTLSVIGGTESLQSLKKRVAELKMKNPKFWIYPQLEVHLAVFEKRLADNPTKGHSPEAGVKAMGSDNLESLKGMGPASAVGQSHADSENAGTSLSIVTILAGLALASIAALLPWLAFRKRER